MMRMPYQTNERSVLGITDRFYDVRCSTTPQHLSATSSPRGSFGKSKSIPIDGAFKRSPSEDQLYLDEIVADNRDYEFCCRVVKGISKSIVQNRMSSPTKTPLSDKNREWYYENRACLDHVLQTRNDCALHFEPNRDKVDYGYFCSPHEDVKPYEDDEDYDEDAIFEMEL